jgi:hypothetical protein
VNEILDALNEYMKAETQEEKDAAFKKIEDNIVKAFEAIKAGIEKGVELLNKLSEDLKESDNPTAQALGNIQRLGPLLGSFLCGSLVVHTHSIDIIGSCLLGELPGQHIVSCVAVGNLNHLALLALALNILSQNNFHNDILLYY